MSTEMELDLGFLYTTGLHFSNGSYSYPVLYVKSWVLESLQQVQYVCTRDGIFLLPLQLVSYAHFTSFTSMIF